MSSIFTNCLPVTPDDISAFHCMYVAAAKAGQPQVSERFWRASDGGGIALPTDTLETLRADYKHWRETGRFPHPDGGRLINCMETLKNLGWSAAYHPAGIAVTRKELAALCRSEGIYPVYITDDAPSVGDYTDFTAHEIAREMANNAQPFDVIYSMLCSLTTYKLLEFCSEWQAAKAFKQSLFRSVDEWQERQEPVAAIDFPAVLASASQLPEWIRENQ